MYKQLSNRGITIKQHVQQKTGNGHLQYCFLGICFI